jgi:hypothetical protein
MSKEKTNEELKVGDKVFLYQDDYGNGSWSLNEIIRETKTQWIVKTNYGSGEKRFYKTPEQRWYDNPDEVYYAAVGGRTSGGWHRPAEMLPMSEKNKSDYESAMESEKRSRLIRELRDLRVISELSTERLEQIVKELKGE